MSIDAIDSVSSVRRPAALNWYDMYANQEQQQPQITNPAAGQTLMSMLLHSLLSAAGQDGSNGDGSSGGAGSPGAIPGISGPSGMSGMGGSSSRPQALLNSLMELLQALTPLLQALGGAGGMAPNGAAGKLADQLGGGAGGGAGSGSGMPQGGGAQGASGAKHGNGHQHANRDLQAPFDPNSMLSPANANVRPPQKPDFTTPAPVTPSVSTPAKTDSSTPVAASSRPGPVLPPHTGEVEVNKPIIVGPGETFDGKNQLFRAGRGLNGGGTAESQDPMFIVAPGGTIKNVQFDGRNGGQLLGDGIHLMGNAKVDNVHGVHGGPDDMITIDGPGNRARDAHLAGIDPKSIPSGPATVEITNSSFRHSHDKAIQINGDANLKMKGIYADDVGQLAVTLGGKPITANVSIEDSTLNGVRSHTFRFDSRNSTLDIKNVETDNSRIQMMAGDPSKVSGATTVMASTDPA